jgi:hypothetical protein
VGALAQRQRSARTVAACRSPSLVPLRAPEVIDHHGARMQIEEAFRDLKSARYGLSFALNLSRSPERIAVLLLTALLAFFVLWLIGQQAIARGLQFDYQSNIRRPRPVLSLFHIAALIVRRAADQLLPRALPCLDLSIAPPPPIQNTI